MGDNTASAGNPLDTLIKYLGPLLGMATAALSLYIAFSTRETNERLATTKAEVEKLNLASTQYDLAARVIHEFGAQNAREFSATYAQKRPPVEVPDAELRRQLVDGVGRWKDGNNLMTGSAINGLYLRQIVYLKLSSMGKTAVTDLRLVVRQKDFDEKLGTQVKRYGLLNTSGWTETTLPLSGLMEASAEARSMRTQVLIPLAQVSGGEYFFGRVLVPVKLLWKDKRLGRDDSLELNVANESTLDNQLHSAILGRSTSGSTSVAAGASAPR